MQDLALYVFIQTSDSLYFSLHSVREGCIKGQYRDKGAFRCYCETVG